MTPTADAGGRNGTGPPPQAAPGSSGPLPRSDDPYDRGGGAAPALLVCVGDLMVDVAVDAPALARGGDVAGSVRLGPGGSAANVAAWARAAGAGARLVAGRGDDLAGRLLAAALAERGIELRPAEPAPSASGALLVVREAGERTFVADPGANLHLDLRQVVGALAGAAAVFVSGYPLLRPQTRAAAMAAAGAAGRAGVPAVVDAASWPLLACEVGQPVLAAAALAGTLLANRDEAATLTGAPDPGVAAALLAATVGTAVVKWGAAGVVVCTGNGRPRPVPAPATGAVDVTGAGDAFAAGYLLARAGGADAAEAAGAGTRLAARAVATHGAWPALTIGGRPEYP